MKFRSNHAYLNALFLRNTLVNIKKKIVNDEFQEFNIAKNNISLFQFS